MIDTITSAISERYHLQRDGKDWLIEESHRAIRLRSPSRASIGFSLDPNGSPALAFFSPDPPEGLAKVCDGMIAVLHRRKLYLFAIEVKSGHKGDAREQLANGRLFWRWLMDLCRQHGYLRDLVSHSYVSLLMWRPRERSPRKGATTHSGEDDLRKTTPDGFDVGFEVRNREDIALSDLIRKC